MKTFLAQFTITKAASGSLPWSAIHAETGSYFDSLPERFEHPGIGWTVTMGGRYFKTKRELVAAIERYGAYIKNRKLAA